MHVVESDVDRVEVHNPHEQGIIHINIQVNLTVDSYCPVKLDQI